MTDSERDLERLFNPKGVAVIGASGKEGKPGHIIFRHLTRSNVQLYPVNPKESFLEGVPVLASAADLPDGLDLVLITLGAEKAVDAAEICAAKGAAYIVIVAGGFGEIGEAGAALEERLRVLPERYGCRLLGPNSLGVFVPENRIDTIFVEHGDKALAEGGGVAFITQSGSVGVESLGLASNSGYGMRAFVGIGNKIDLGERDFLHYFGRDPWTRCLAYYLESLEEGRLFLREAAAVSAEKPVVILKAGRTAAGAAAVSSHTGRMAGSDRIVNAALKQHGLQRAYDDEELCDASKTLSLLPPAAGNRVAVLTPAGGFGVMCADYIDSAAGSPRLVMAELAEETKARIQAATFPFAACHNPVDLTASADNRMFTASLEALLNDPGVDIVIAVTFFAPPSITDALIDEMAAMIEEAAKPVLIFTQYGPYTDRYLKRFFQAGIAGFPSISRVVRAARILVERGEIVRRKRAVTDDLVRQRAGNERTPDYPGLIAEWRRTLREAQAPHEGEAKELLARAGLHVPAGIVLEPGQEGPGQVKAAGLRYPLVAKVCSSRILHKTDSGGVKLKLDAERLPGALAELGEAFPGEPLLVEEMLPYDGTEFILGALDDPVFGPAVMAGAGGIYTEILNDAAFRLAPCSREEAEEMLNELQLAPVLRGYRGSSLDGAALAEVLRRVSLLAASLVEGGGQLDINPLVWSRGRWIVLDAKIILPA